jgi:hypothetical protein
MSGSTALATVGTSAVTASGNARGSNSGPAVMELCNESTDAGIHYKTVRACMINFELTNGMPTRQLHTMAALRVDTTCIRPLLHACVTTSQFAIAPADATAATG